MSTHDGFDRELDGRNGIDRSSAFRETGIREARIREHRIREEGTDTNGSYEYGIGNAFRNSIGGRGSVGTKERNEISEQRRRSAEKMHDEELSRSRGMQEYWKRLSERVADVGQKINQRINKALDNPVGAGGTEPDSSSMTDNENDAMREQENDPKPYRRIE